MAKCVKRVTFSGVVSHWKPSSGGDSLRFQLPKVLDLDSEKDLQILGRICVCGDNGSCFFFFCGKKGREKKKRDFGQFL